MFHFKEFLTVLYFCATFLLSRGKYNVMCYKQVSFSCQINVVYKKYIDHAVGL